MGLPPEFPCFALLPHIAPRGGNICMGTMQNVSHLKISREETFDGENSGVVDKLNKAPGELCFEGVLLGPVSFVVPHLS